MSYKKTLIVYATKGGTTEEYANAINSVLTNEFNIQTDLVNLKKTRNPDLEQYKNIIIGTGIKMFRMHQDGAKFLEKNNFGEKKVGIFISSLMPREEVKKRYIDVILKKNTTLEPFDMEVFGGRIRIFGKTSQDMVDIERAKEWTRTISEHLQS
jgi:menaquinone-dependent protoporphyrinogen IX oxidase